MATDCRKVALALVGLLASGCLIEVQIDKVRDPREAFREARAEALRYQGRRGPAQQLRAVIYDPDDGKLIRVTLPMWLVRKAGRNQDWDWDEEQECRGQSRKADDRSGRDQRCDSGERVEHTLRRHVSLKDIERAGLGILVEVEEDRGERVLVWLR